MATRTLKRGLLGLYVAAFAALVYFTGTGASYYLTPLVERPRHEDYWLLKPGGTLGLAFGVIGSVLMTVMLLYSVRKRVSFLRRFAHLRSWLHFHIFCGVTGPLFIVLHSSFKVQGLVSFSFWSMVIVALSGFFGRFLYGLIPRKRSGDELTLAESVAFGEELKGRLKTEFHLSSGNVEELARLASVGLKRTQGLGRLLVGLPFESLALRWRLRSFRRRLEAPAQVAARDFAVALSRAAHLERRVRLWSEVHRLFYYWHLFHKPFSIIMYLFMAIHIAVAFATGYARFGG